MVKWLAEARNSRSTFDGMGVSPIAYQTLDCQLSVALQAVIKNATGRFQAISFKISLAMTRSYEKSDNLPIRGRQMLFVIHQFFAQRDAREQYFVLEQLRLLSCPAEKDLPTFLHNWEKTCIRLTVNIEPEIKREMFASCVQHLQTLSHLIARFNEKTKPYEWLLLRCQEHVAFHDDQQNREAMKRSLLRTDNHLALPAADDAAPASSTDRKPPWEVSCRSEKGGRPCKLQGCKFLHTVPGSVPTIIGSRPSDSNRGRQPTRDDNPGTGAARTGSNDSNGSNMSTESERMRRFARYGPCFDHAMGKCSREKCAYQHKPKDEFTPTELEALERFTKRGSQTRYNSPSRAT